MRRPFKKLLRATLKFDTLNHAIAEEMVNTGKPVMGYIRENGDLILKPIEIDTSAQKPTVNTGTYTL